MSFTSGYVRAAGHELHYTDWGRDERGTVLAWHGLARTGRDMDELAEWLSQQGWRVICPDTIGRGLSQWSSQPAEHYQLAFYARLARELLDALSVRAVHWVGTSMGGAIGMRCAAGRCEPGMANRLLSLVLMTMPRNWRSRPSTASRPTPGNRPRLPPSPSSRAFCARPTSPLAGSAMRSGGA